ncbi:MAG: PAS domain S-box protein, partial [Dehalococcoidia bacterium]
MANSNRRHVDRKDTGSRALTPVGTVRDVTKDKQAEEALRESEARYKALFAGAPEGMLVADLQTKQFRHANPALCRMFGYTEEEFLRIGVADIHPKESLSYVLAEFEAQARGEKLLSADLPCRRKDGSLFYADVNAVMVVLDGRRCSVGIFTDVTQRKKTEEALRESEERFRNVLEVSRDLIYELNLQTSTYDYVSPSSLRLVGFAPQEVVAMGLEGVRERFHPEDRERFQTYPSRLPDDTVEGHEAPTIEYRWQCKNGEYRWLSDNRAFVLDEGGRALALVGTVRDVTEEKQAQEALRESEEKYRQLVEKLQEGVWAIDKDANTTFANPRMAEILGCTVSEMLGRHVYSFMDEPGRELTRVKLERRRQGVSEQYELEFLRKDGTKVHTSLATNPVTDRNGSYIGAVAAVTDITDKKQTDEEIANRLKMEYAIAQASTLLAGPEDIDAGLDLALRILGEAFGADRAHIFLFRDNDTRMDNTSEWCAPGVEPQIDDLQDIDCTAIPWWMGKLAQNDPIIMTDTSAAPPDAVAAKKSWKALNIRSLLAVPLLSDGKPIGYVRFANMESASNEREEDIRLLRLASESITSFIERQRAGEDKRKAYESIVMLLAIGAEARDPYTEHHLPRIRGFAEAMAAELGLPPAEIREIGLCSLLHDLGKLRVPDSILTKPGPLSQAEWNIMKQHPAWGEELLSTHPWLETARQIARWHHERWDGTGYPDGLRGEQIPLGAAIVTVADSLDAMTSDRPYKKAWPSSRAIREIRAQRGRQYSPNVV